MSVVGLQPFGEWRTSKALVSLLQIIILLHWKMAYSSMPKFLTNEEETSRHLKKNIGYWPVQMNGDKFATGQILRKLVEVVKGRILAG
jgi:hypothetical protein